MLDLDAAIRDQAYEFFVQEAQEFLHLLEAGILDLRESRDIPKVHTLMRAAHSIKGGAAGVGLDSIQAIAHRLENVFRALYHQEVELDLSLEDLLLQAYDALRSPLMQEIETGKHDADSAVAIANPIFEKLETRLGDALRGEYKLPTAAELGIDVVHEIFTGDVTHALARLDRVLASPDTEQVAGEIRAQAEVFFGVGQLVNLPGFVAIARATLDALIQQPQNFLLIGHIALADFRAAQTAILAGDRVQGGMPSPALLGFSQEAIAELPESTESAVSMNASDLEAIFGDAQQKDSSSPQDDLSEQVFEDLEAELSEYTLEESPVDLEGLETLFSEETPADYSDIDDAFAEISALAEELKASEKSKPELPLHKDETESIVKPEETAIDFSSYVQKPQVEPKPRTATTPQAPYISGTIKIDLHRLEKINNLIGELVTEESSAVLQNQQLQNIIAAVTRRLTHVEQVAKDLQDWTDYNQRSTVQWQAFAQSGFHHTAQNSAFSAQFDPLQMDSYNRLHLMAQELIEETAQLGEAIRDVTLISQQGHQLQRQKQRTLKQVRNQLLRARMFPIGDILQRFPRMIRDLSAKYDKQVSFKISGTSTLVDKSVLERLFDPLVHLVRNAFDHGIELPEARRAAGKPAEATIEVRAYHRGNQTYLEVCDDGGGINVDRVRAKAIAQKLISEETAAILPKERLYEFLFSPGFSTAAEVSELSGRGVGLDAVMAQIRSLKGSISITSEVGKGTSFILRFPLTLTIAELLVFSIDSHQMAIPVDSLIAIVAARLEEFEQDDDQVVYRWQNQAVPVYSKDSLSQHYPLMRRNRVSRSGIPMPQDGTIPLLLIAGETEMVALPIDQILQQQELVIKPFGSLILPPPYLYGCTILGDGSLVPVMDGQALVQHHREGYETAWSWEEIEPLSTPEIGERVTETILVVDDSMTARQALAATLKKAGYEVIHAQNGKEALLQVQQRNTEIRAIFCDVEMPKMNGFEFLSQYRRELGEAALPVIMLTSRNSQKHRQVASALGAAAYLTKPYQETVLISALKEAMSQSVEVVAVS
ncbi:CheA-like two-component hybrid sensor and regulator [Leptolyngbya sp. NIES-3755]|nr:CheA-like two-component hybrid sensor and regulator [Leptolyngbya sp. NIES-3755]